MDEGFLIQNERTLFIALAIGVWCFIVHTLYSSFVTRRELQRELDSLPRVGEQTEKEKNTGQLQNDDDTESKKNK